MKLFPTSQALIHLHNITAVDFVGSDTTVVGTLGSREPILRPTQGMAISIKQSVLLLHPKPGRLILGLLHDLAAQLAVVGGGGSLVVLVGLAHHHDVVSTSEGIRVDLAGVEVGVGVAALRLVGGAPVIVPDGQVLHAPRLLVQGLGLVPGMSLLLRTTGLQICECISYLIVPDSLTSSIYPDVAGLHPVDKTLS